MFQVEPDRVLFATGAPKDLAQIREHRRLRKAQRKEAKQAAEAKDVDTLEQTESEAVSEVAAASTPAIAENVDEADVQEKRKQRKVDMKKLLDQAKSIIADKKNAPSARRKQELRGFTQTVRRAIGNINKLSAEDLDNELNKLVSQLTITSTPASQESDQESASKDQAYEDISSEDREALFEAMRRAKENPIDESKPYATPWRPRPFMPAFAFIPRYLEVNQKICSAVYLRHPVARPGLAEVPTPFGAETQQLAFNWYLRRR